MRIVLILLMGIIGGCTIAETKDEPEKVCSDYAILYQEEEECTYPTPWGRVCVTQMKPKTMCVKWEVL
jgi:hypothetical protein